MLPDSLNYQRSLKVSEYQYYEFLAIERTLNIKEMNELREISTRASITPTQFKNVYNFGDLKADPMKMLARYFDLHIYVANWGSHRFVIRIPQEAIPMAVLIAYRNSKAIHTIAVGKREYLIIDLWLDMSGEAFWEYDGGWDDGSGWMASLAGVRSELLQGDMRLWYLSWLLSAESGEIDDDEEEPMVPPGLGNLSPSLQALAEFLQIDRHLLQAAAEGSSPLEASSRADIAQMIAELSVEEKDNLLLRVTQGEQAQVSAALISRFRAEKHQAAGGTSRFRRTLGQIRARAEKLQELYEREQTRKAEEDQRQKKAAEAAARTKYLNTLSVRQAETWDTIEHLVAAMKSKSYDQAVQLLMDLGELAERDEHDEHDKIDDNRGEYARRLLSLRKQNAAKRSFIAKLNRAVRLKKEDS
jgi:hypothetical protein